ncbi:intraflagellar transport 20 isoform X2 [Temnothorax americanus]|uniref:intraflagellar transport 20 isoform X2 n=1 Tax=Temnothorax americanus TaxID=1964332 RepID=UPI004068D03F
MADSLTKYGVYIDDLSKIRVLEPEAANQTNKLKEECQSFVSSINLGEVRGTGTIASTTRFLKEDRTGTARNHRTFFGQLI